MSSMIKQIMEKLSIDVSKNKNLKEEIDALIVSEDGEIADAYWPVLKLALLDSNLRIIALNSIQKLVAHNLLKGTNQGDKEELQEYLLLQSELSYAGDADKPAQQFCLIDEIVQTAAKVAFKHEEQASVQLQVLKLFLTIVTSDGGVHAYSLLVVLKICFLIHNASPMKSTNEVTSKASLTQMINLIFSRLERFPTLYRLELDMPISSIVEVQSSKSDSDKMPNPGLQVGVSEEDMDLVHGHDTPAKVVLANEQEGEQTSTEEFDKAVHSLQEKELLEKQFEICKNDVRMVLRFLCHIGVSKDGNESTPSELLTDSGVDELSPTRSKDRILALELILSVFQNLGQIFRRDASFFAVVKDRMPLVISRNAGTSNSSLFELSISLFLLNIRFYRHLLKLEIEVQLGMYLQILESGNSTYKQKSTILQGLLKICENPQTLLDIYLNYDCEFEMSSIYEKIVSICSRITQGRGDTTTASSQANSGLAAVFGDSKHDLIRQQDRRLHLRSLCILTTIIQSLVSWTKLEDQPISAIDSKSGPISAAEEDGDHSNPVIVGKNPLTSVSLKQAPSIISSASENDKAEMVASKKQDFRKALKLFASNPKKGMKAFLAGGFVENTPRAIAAFLLHTKELNKASIGEYIGEGGEFNIRVMHSFIDALDFTNYNFVGALRYFLQSFRLPGEAQKIDRMMEKFADRYCELNSTIFAKADTAYTLAFSVIMLNTDQHSAQIKHRMDKAAFIKNNRGINDDGDLPDDFLGSIFDEISQNEIIMEDERSDKLMKITLGWGAGESSEKQRREIFKQEMSLIQKKTHLLMTEGASNRTVSTFRIASDKELTRSMFSQCSWALMAALSISFEGAPGEQEAVGRKSKEPNVAELCLVGFSGAICLACIHHLETERDAFVSSLAKLTSLSKFYDIKAKNIKAIGTLIDVATAYGEYMDTAWPEVIKSLSSLEKMQVVVRGEDKAILGGLENEKENGAVKEISRILQRYAEEVQSQNFLIVIDRIFTNSVKLSAPAIISFFKAVCQISLEEVGLVIIGENGPAGRVHPRMYLLQKIVEIAHYNMHRIRFEWTQIWRVLQPHFNRVACHPSLQVANYAIDSLRQLGAKFLEREELGQFSTQHEFLKSFETIIKQNQSPSVRELILNSLNQLITTRASRIRSGWKSIFVTLAKAAQTDEKLAQLSFQSVQLIFRKHFEDVVAAGGFVDLVSCLTECALLPGGGPVHDELVMSSIQMLQSCTNSLIERGKEEEASRVAESAAVDLPTSPSQRRLSILRINNLPQQPYLTSKGFVSEEHFYLSWFPILSAFSRVVNESEGVLVRTHTMEILFETLKNSGYLFDGRYWKSISRNIVSPFFEELNDPDIMTVKESNSAVMILGLRLLVQLINAHFELLSSVGDSDFIQGSVDIMVDMMAKTDDKLASTGQTCFSQFLSSNVAHFNDASWTWVVQKIENGFQRTLPSELVRCQDSNQKPDQAHQAVTPKIYDAAMKATEHLELISLDSLAFEKTIVKCITHLEFLSSIKDFCFLKVNGEKEALLVMPKEASDRILEMIYSSYAVARLFNSLTSLRHAIFKRGWVAQLPNLVKQETTSLLAYISLLFVSARADADSATLEDLGFEIVDLFTRFNKLLIDPSKSQRDIISWSPIVITVFRELCGIPGLWEKEGAFSDEIPKIYRLAVRMIGVDRYLERSEMKPTMIEFFEKVGLMYFQ